MTPTTIHPLAVWVLGLLGAAQSGGSTTCNDQARTITTQAGNTSTGTQQCVSFSFTITVGVASVDFSFPDSCDTGRREQTKDCYDCGPTSTGNHCTARGFETTTKIYSIGNGNPCPAIPSSLPTTLAEAQAIVHCAELPLIETENTWCAKVKTCAGQTVAEYQHGELIQRGGYDVLVWLADPSELLPGPVPNPTAEAVASMRSLPLSEVPPALAAVWSACPPLPGVAEFDAELERLFARGGPEGEDIKNVHRVTGTVLDRGRFSVEHLMPATREGDPSLVAEDLAYDGASFFWGSHGLPFYQAYGSSSREIEPALRLQSGFMRSFTDFVDDPLGILLLQGSAFTTQIDNDNSSVVVIRETYPGVESPFSKGETTYWIDT
ncbi:MAG: hypothetical protein ACYTKD_30930, partial [Planctomycetota bacterium]